MVLIIPDWDFMFLILLVLRMGPNLNNFNTIEIQLELINKNLLSIWMNENAIDTQSE